MEKQQMRYTEQEIALIKNTFAEEFDLLKTIRKAFFQGGLTSDEVTTLKNLSPEVVALLKKLMLPEVTNDLPIGQQVDLWMTINVVDNKGNLKNEFASRQKLIDFIEDGLNSVKTGKTKKSNIETYTYDTKANENKLYVDIMARNTFISHVNQRLIELMSLAGKKESTNLDKIAQAKLKSTK